VKTILFLGVTGLVESLSISSLYSNKNHVAQIAVNFPKKFSISIEEPPKLSAEQNLNPAEISELFFVTSL
jgi:hypothetical protein